jgi:hypothetical protein
MWTSKPEEDYRDVIAEYAEAGWRFVQVVPKNWYTASEGYYMDVIFERPKDQYL